MGRLAFRDAAYLANADGCPMDPANLVVWVPKTSSAGWIDAKRAVERQPY